MIYTLTLNPALDHIVRTDELQIGETNRMVEETIKAGGKGINVSKILKNLGERSIAFAYVAGFSGFELERILRDEEKILCDFIHVKDGYTRINVKIKADQETEINGPGLEIGQDEVEELYKKLEDTKDGDYLFLSGSIPSSLGQDFYRKIMEHLKGKDIKVAVDAVGDSLRNTLDLGPYLIKPNRRELEDFFQTSVDHVDEIEHYSRELQKLGAKNIIISLGGDGAFFLAEDGSTMKLEAPKGEVIDTVGSGDSMVAGFMYAVKNGYDLKEAFKYSVACGSATAFSKELGQKEEIFNLYGNL